MSDRGPLYDQTETPEDVATLYSWANLHGAKYRDFSESRAHTREQARLRMQQAIEAEQARAQQSAQAERDAEAQSMTEAEHEEEARHSEWTAQLATQQAALEDEEQAAQEPARKAEEQAAAELAARQAEEEVERKAAEEEAAREAEATSLAAAEAERRAEEEAAQQAAAAEAERQAAEWAAQETTRQAQEQAAQEAMRKAEEATRLEAGEALRQARLAQAAAQAQQVPQDVQPHSDATSYTPPQEQQTEASEMPSVTPYEDGSMTQRNPWGQPDQRDNASRPAWLTPEQHPEPVSASVLPAPDDTLQGSRERLASRWYILRGLFESVSAPPEPAPEAPAAKPPVVAVFSLAGGVGKTSVAATLGRALSARGERVLLVDTAAYGLMPFFFGAQDQRPGVLRTFSPPGTSGDAQVQMLTVDPETLGQENAAQELLVSEIGKYTRGISRVIVDLPTASGATTRRIVKMAPIVLVPMMPDMNSVVSVSSIDSFFERNGGESSKQPYYILNQFDPSLPLHLDIREVLREQLGDRLLQVVVRRSPAMSEALAEGMTVMDYAPNSTVAEDFASLASWVKTQSAPATSTYRGVRWSER